MTKKPHPLALALAKAIDANNAHSREHGGLVNNELFARFRKCYDEWAKAGKPMTED